MIKRMLGWFNRTKGRPKSSVDSLVYFGVFGWSVNQAYGSDKHVIATYSGWDELDELTSWCKENGCQCFWDRVVWDRWMNRWSSNGIGGFDCLFIQADSDDTSALARLTWGI